MIKNKIKIYEPDIEKYKKSAIDAINSGWISNHGEYVAKTEELLKKIFNIPYLILMSNGTCAVHCLFLSIKFKYPKINKIYVSNNSYVAAWNPILSEYDISSIIPMKMDINTCNIIEDENYIKSLEKDSCVLIVHNVGNIVNVPRLKKIRPDLIFIEDNCEGLFGKYENEFAGMSSSTFCSACSFYGNKIITSGEGGAFFTHDKEVYKYIKSIYSQGMSSTRYLHNLQAYNYRMTNIQAAFIYDQLIDYVNIIENKKKIFNNYDKLFKDTIKNNKVKLIKINKNTEKAPWIYAIRLIDNKLSVDEIMYLFEENLIEIRPFFYPINFHEHLNTIKMNDPVSIQLNKDYILLPSSPKITLEEQKYIVNFINKNFDK